MVQQQHPQLGQQAQLEAQQQGHPQGRDRQPQQVQAQDLEDGQAERLAVLAGQVVHEDPGQHRQQRSTGTHTRAPFGR